MDDFKALDNLVKAGSKRRSGSDKPKEAGLNTWFKGQIKQFNDKLGEFNPNTIDYMRLENSVGSGRPDVFLFSGKKFATFELKTSDKPVRRITLKRLFSPEQWVRVKYNASYHDMNSYALIKFGSGIKADYLLIPCCQLLTEGKSQARYDSFNTLSSAHMSAKLQRHILTTLARDYHLGGE